MHDLPRPLNITLFTLALLGSLALAGAFVAGTFFTNAPFLILALFTVVCSPLSVSLGARVRLSTLQVFVLAAVLLAGTPEAVMVAAVGGLSLVAVTRPRPSLHQAVAMLTGYPLEALLAGWAFQIAGGQPGEFTTGASLVALLFATVCYYFAHTLIAATLVGFEERTTVLVVWFDRYAWTLPSFLSAGAAAGLSGILVEWAGLHAFVLLVPFVLLLFQHYRMRAQREREREAMRCEIERLREEGGRGAGGAGGNGSRPEPHPDLPYPALGGHPGHVLSGECPPEGVRRRRWLARPRPGARTFA